MTEKLQQIIKEGLVKLPKENQDAIGAFDWAKTAEEIGKKYLFSESEINDFQVETMLVLFGLENPDLYTVNIENNIGTSKNEAEKITEEVIQKIFTPINDILIENIKKSEKAKNPNAEQTLNFILSGGNYAAFVENPPRLVEKGAGSGDFRKLPPRPDLSRGTPPQRGGVGNNTNIEIRPEELK